MEEGGALGRQRAKQVSPFCATGTVGISGVQNCRAVAQAEWVIVLGREGTEDPLEIPDHAACVLCAEPARCHCTPLSNTPLSNGA